MATYRGDPNRHDLIRDIIARENIESYKIFTEKLKFLKNYIIDEYRTEFEVWEKIVKRIKLYSFKTKPEPSGRLDIIFALKGIGEKEGIGRILCVEIKDGQFTLDDIYKYMKMENVHHNMPVLPGDSSEDPIIVLAWMENINLATDNNPDRVEREHNWSIRFIPLEHFYPLIQNKTRMVTEGIL
jgi:hypothetical protein